ncbi:nuclear pore complex protein Nup98-Nup96-like [Protopterus annectens]|uniref:nuclear pore complex protein Nup98-Nup96-like n=1 Tax=Protopterus annectens TaxID=7888 RepID=UPI001CFBFEB6|nr:nuclear pore complex protein Nup98-Nup96-like [Protopterus annectens]XP_043934253.1 nuclear pore complex protein Nup98-Nup96-like [Protopterus annectens]
MFKKLFGTLSGKEAGRLWTTSTFRQTTGFGPGFASGPGASTNTTVSVFEASTGTSARLSGINGSSFSLQMPFTQNKPVVSGSLGNTTNIGKLLMTNNTAFSPVVRARHSLFGSDSFETAAVGTTIKFNPVMQMEIMVEAGVSSNSVKRFQCITAMREYENKSLEELRLEDYQTGKKGSQDLIAAPGHSFGTSTATSVVSRNLFGAANTKMYGQTVGFSDGNVSDSGTSAFAANTFGSPGSTQPKSEGLFDISTSNQPSTSSTITVFAFGASSGTSSSLAGFTSTGSTVLSSQNHHMQNRLGGSGSFGNTVNSGRLLNATNTTFNPFVGASTPLFGSSCFGTSPVSTNIKFNPVLQMETEKDAGTNSSIMVCLQCITAMKEYESKSLEELRLEDYQVGRKGSQNLLGPSGSLFGNPIATSTVSTILSGAAATSPMFSFGANKTTFGTMSTALRTSTRDLSGQQLQPGTVLLNKTFVQSSTTPNTGFPFGNTNSLSQSSISSVSLFEKAPASQQGLFGASTTNTVTGCGTGLRVLGTPDTTSGSVGTQNVLGNTTVGFGTIAPSFSSTGSGAPVGGTNLVTGTQTSGCVSTSGTAVTSRQTSFFGNKQPKCDMTTGSLLGTTAINPTETVLNFGAMQSPVALTDLNAAAFQQVDMQQQLYSLMYSPYGDSPLFRNPISDSKGKEECLKPTNTATQKTVTTSVRCKLIPYPPIQVHPKGLKRVISPKSPLYDGLDSDDDFDDDDDIFMGSILLSIPTY